MNEVLELADYTIHLGDCQQALQTMLAERNYSRVVVLTDENTHSLCLPRIQAVLPVNAHFLQIPAGEKHKTIATCQDIWQQLLTWGIDRRAVMLNLGGGVIGDMGGFCASTFKRGIDFIQLPTTLLSQVDASIGGKLGIDFGQVKNSVGVFQNPQAVFVDPGFLNTLPHREIRSGFAEIIKHALIADANQWANLAALETLNTVDWSSLIGPSLRIKQAIVSADPFEYGLRKALNFGHTIGHGIEGVALDSSSPLLHGEAIAIGMFAESYIAYQRGLLPEASFAAIAAFLHRHYGSYSLPPDQFPAYVALMANDKKNDRADLNFSLIGPIGKVHINQTATPAEVYQAMEAYNTYCQAIGDDQ